MPQRHRALALVVSLAVLPMPWLAQAVELPRVFADGMVLQRDAAVPVWGKAAAGASLTVDIAGQRHSAKADADGRWQVALEPLKAGGAPLVLRVDDGGAPREIRDVLVGDVWLASGQSNMEWTVAESDDAAATIAGATDPLVRHFKIPHAASSRAAAQLPGGDWVAASPSTAGTFSAVAYAFARDLRKSTGVPIGIIDATWGGSRIEPWMDAQALGIDADEVAARMQALEDADARTVEATRKALARWPGLPADDAGWQAPDVDESQWTRIAVPGFWEDAGYAGMDGIAWYRTAFSLSADEARRGATLTLGGIDDGDTTWVNGVDVGHSATFDVQRRYAVPASALRAGRNVVAVRVTDGHLGGGITGPADAIAIEPVGGARRALAGDWRFRVAKAQLSTGAESNQRPTLLYNAMIRPLQPYALRGVIWYQGESNAGTVADAQAYARLFPALIGQWRTQWTSPGLPFLWVQLARFDSKLDRDGSSPWATLRASQAATLSVPHTAQALAIDIGARDDIHPRNKHEVGRRLALAARRVAYGEDVDADGPVFARATFADGAATLTFAPGSGPLAARGGGDAIHGIELAGSDGRFHAATARIDGDRVVARSDAVPRPAAVRYAWKDFAGDADLVDAAGLPAAPFLGSGR